MRKNKCADHVDDVNSARAPKVMWSWMGFSA